MAVTYNKINWDEETPITVANLDRIDVGIDEVVTQSNSNESRITTNENDISNIEDGTTSAGNALALQGESLEVVAEGSITGDTTHRIDLLPNQNHYKYIFDVYCPTGDVGYTDLGNSYATILKRSSSGDVDQLYISSQASSLDKLVISNDDSISKDYKYFVWALR